MIEPTVFQDESDFPLQIPRNSENDCAYFKGQKKDKLVLIPDFFFVRLRNILI